MSRNTRVISAAGLLLLTLMAYLPVMLHGGWIWDDDAYVTNNPTLQTAGGLEQIWANSAPEYNKQYYPLVHSTFWIEYHVWGLRTAIPYHVDNVLLHALNAVLLWIILRKLAVPGAWLIAAIFGVHPVEVESVAWVTERKNVLSGAFYLLSLLAYLKFSGLGADVGAMRQELAATTRTPRGRWVLYAVSLLLFVCALLSKSVTCSLPVIIGLLLWWKKPRLNWRDLAPLAPFLLIGMALGLHTAHMESKTVGAHGAEWALTPIARCLIAGRALWFYAGKLLWPWPLIFSYRRWNVSELVWWQYLFPLAWIGGLAALVFLRKRLGRAPLVAVLYFSVTLFPALGFVNIYPMKFTFVADHYQYLASIGLICMGVGIAVHLVRKHTRGLWVGYLAGAGVLAVLSTLTWAQGAMYHNAETLWVDTIARNSEAALAYENLGTRYYEEGRLDQAQPLLEMGLKLEPGWINGYINLGNVALMRGQPREAISIFERGIASLGLSNKNYEAAVLYNSYGSALASVNQTPQAIVEFRRAIQCDVQLPEAHANLGRAYLTLGNTASAVEELSKALELRQDYPSARALLEKAVSLQNGNSPGR